MYTEMTQTFLFGMGRFYLLPDTAPKTEVKAG